MLESLPFPHPPGLTIAVVPERDRVVITPEGELDIASVDAVRHKVAALRARGFQSIVLDLRGLTFVDSCTIHLLLELESAATADGSTFTVQLGVASPARRLLVLAGLGERFACV
jgi:anti-anti-sigma factor